MKPEIIITARGHAGTMATLQAEFTAHLLAEAPDRAAFLKQHADAVRGVATFGPMTVDGKFMDALPKLEIISNFGVGVDAINLDDAKKRGLIVTNTPDVLNEAVADTTLAKTSDVLIVVTPGGPEPAKLVNAKVLDALGPQGFLVNIARGSVIDEPVLLRYLQEKRIAGAGLDVFADEPRVPPEFFTLENAVLFPHVGSATVETRKAMGDLQIENLRLHFAGKPVRTRAVYAGLPSADCSQICRP